MHYKLFGKKLALDKVKGWISFIAVPILLLFFTNLYKAPFEILKKKDAEYSGQLEEYETKITILEDDFNDLKLRSADIRIAQQQPIESISPKFPFGLEIIIQTNISIKPVAFAIRFNGEIDYENMVFRPNQPAGSMSNIFLKPIKPNAFIYGWESPTFTPETNVVVRVYSKKRIKVIGFKRIVQ